jgi:hypothetical protein
MTNDDFDRTSRLWLEDGPTVLSDRVLQAALDEIHVTRQRLVMWPARRNPFVTNLIRLSAALAAIVIVAVGVNLLLPDQRGVGGPAATPTSTPRPLPTDNATVLPAGTYMTVEPFPVRMTFAVPAGWLGRIGGPYYAYVERSDGLGLIDFSSLGSLYADPCHAAQGLLDPQPGPSVDDLATALANLPTVVASTPVETSIGGKPAAHLTLTAPALSDVGDCSVAEGFRIWELPLGSTFGLEPGQRAGIWIVDVDGERIVMDVPEASGATQADRDEVQAIVDSIRFESAN